MLCARRLAVGLCVLVGLVAGCSSATISGPKVKGKIIDVDGSPFSFKPGAELVTLEFRGTHNGQPFNATAEVNRDGTFKLDGPEDAGVPVGSYKVVLSVLPYGAAASKDAPSERYNRSFADWDTTPLTFELTRSNALRLIINLQERTITAN
jgi:hypothetical protein